MSRLLFTRDRFPCNIAGEKPPRRPLKAAPIACLGHQPWLRFCFDYPSELAAGSGMPNYRAFIQDPNFLPMHGMPEFQALMRGLRRVWTSCKAEFGY